MISVIVPFLNEESFIEQCLMALLGQDVASREYELIFIDNGSHDHSADIVRRFPEVRLLAEPRPGPYAARNAGLAAARGQLIAFTDADCVPAHDWLRQICEGMARTGAAVALGARRLSRRGSGVLRMCEDYENAKIAHVLQGGVRQVAFGFTNNMAMRAEVIQALGLFSECIGVSADTEYLQRYLAQFHQPKVAYLPQMTVTHLEVCGVRPWLEKQMIYGRASRAVERVTSYRPLSYRERFRIYRGCGAANHYSLRRQLGLLGVLVAGGLCFVLGRLWGASGKACHDCP